ncbi:MAG TPA: sigma-54 dependent transcriptional regulator [Burkholderiaceae bacterium]
MKQVRTLVVDDEAHMRRVLEIMLAQLGHVVDTAPDGRQALEILQRERFDLVLTDLRMPGLDGLGLLEGMSGKGIGTPLIVMTAQGSVASAVQAMRLGACDYLVRPFDVDVLELAIERVLSNESLRVANRFLRDQVARPAADFFGESPAMRSVFEQIRKVGPTRATVLITGETGTGKELAARAVHDASDRSASLFVPINCAAMPADMVEAELFGHDKGAFTGAVRDRVGKFELASGGTIFLDEITEMPIGLQAKLLRVLQEGRIERLGSNRRIDIDMRVVAACNVDPREAVRAGKLREDLFYRLNVFSLALPPLRERRSDIEGLARALARRQGQVLAIEPEALALLGSYSWPGNVRELDNVVQRALILAGGAPIGPRHLPADLAPSHPPAAHALSGNAPDADPASLDLARATEALEDRLIARALEASGDNKRKAAALLGVSERTLWYKLGRNKPAADAADGAEDGRPA